MKKDLIFFLKLIQKKDTYDGEPCGRRIIRVTTTFSCLRTVRRSFMERIFQTLMIVDVYGTAPCNAAKSHTMLCDAFSNMLVILLPILEYLSHLLSDSQTVFTLIISISQAFL